MHNCGNVEPSYNVSAYSFEFNESLVLHKEKYEKVMKKRSSVYRESLMYKFGEQ